MNKVVEPVTDTVKSASEDVRKTTMVASEEIS